jgi:hypothetical protein
MKKYLLLIAALLSITTFNCFAFTWDLRTPGGMHAGVDGTLQPISGGTGTGDIVANAVVCSDGDLTTAWCTTLPTGLVIPGYPLDNGTNATGTWSIDITGNSATVTTNANLTGAVTSSGNVTTYNTAVPLSKSLNANLTASNGGIFYSTASAGAILSGTATANKVLMSGATAAPTWSTPTFPNASATSGKIIQSDGTNWIASTPTFPTTAGTAGKILRSDGTNILSTTSTFSDTYSASNLLYSNGANTVTGLATANNGALVTDGSGVPSIASLGNSKILASNSSGTVSGRSFTIKTTVFVIGGGATQTFTPQTGSLWCFVKMVGGGGGSGGTASTSASQFAAAGGGSAGEYAEGLFSTATMIGAGTTTQINIGAAGTAGTAGNNAGGNGGTTSIIANGGSGSTLMTATNGFGGAGAAATSTGISFPGIGGGNSGSGGDYHTQGGITSGSIASAVGLFALGGSGGSSMMGAGGPAVTNAAGVSGSGAGSGASGACAYPSNSALAGALGKAGQVVITEYIIN